MLSNIGKNTRKELYFTSLETEQVKNLGRNLEFAISSLLLFYFNFLCIYLLEREVLSYTGAAIWQKVVLDKYVLH